MSVVADAGPLMALAKIGALDLLFQLFPEILVPPAVYEEVVTAGLRIGAPDAVLLQDAFSSQQLRVRQPDPSSAPIPGELGAGESESIQLAIEIKADWLLMDDYAARSVAETCLRDSMSGTRLKGTLGIIVSSFEAKLVSLAEATRLLTALQGRSDIWISEDLCRRVIETLQSES